MSRKSSVPTSDLLWGSAVVLIVILQFWWLPGEQRAPSDSWSASVDGKLGLYRTLSQLFPIVTRDARQLIPPRPASLLLIAPERNPTVEEQDALYRFVYGGGTLLFAPGWTVSDCRMPALGIEVRAEAESGSHTEAAAGTTGPGQPPGTPAGTSNTDADAPSPGPAEDPQRPTAGEMTAEAEESGNATSAGASGSDAPAATSSGDEDESELEIPKGEARAAPRGGTGPTMETLDGMDRPQTVEVTVRSELVDNAVLWRKSASISEPGRGFASRVLVRSGEGVPEVLAWELGQGRVVLCSSPDVFSNRGLLDRHSRRLAVRLIEYGHAPLVNGTRPAPIVLCEYLSASDAWRHAGVLLSPALRIGSLQLMLLAVLAGWYGFHRFGPARREHTARRRNLADSARAVGDLQYRLRDGGPVVRQYLDYVSHLLRRRAGHAVRLDDLAELSARSGQSEDALREQLGEAVRLQTSERVSPEQTAASIRWLSRLKRQLTESADDADGDENASAESDD